MSLSKVKSAVTLATTAVLLYNYPGAPGLNHTDFLNPTTPMCVPEEMCFDYYGVSSEEQKRAADQIEIIHQFASNILDNIKDLDPEFSKTVDENFWDLI